MTDPANEFGAETKGRTRMSKPTYSLCDRCGEKTTASMYVETGYEFNGVENMRIGKDLDMCGGCAMHVLKCLIVDHYKKDSTYEFAERVIELMKPLKKQERGT